MNFKWISTAIFVIFFTSILVVAAFDCNYQKQVRGVMHEWKAIAAESLVVNYDEAEKFIKSGESVNTICGHLIEQHEAEIKAGTYPKAMLDADCKPLLKEKLEKLNEVVGGFAYSLLVFEHGIDGWEDYDQDEKIAMVGDMALGLRDLESVLKACGVEVPDWFDGFMDYLEMLGRTLKAMDEGE